LLLSLLLLVSCHSRPAPGTVAAWTRPEYFAPGLLHPDPGVAAVRQEWYADALARLGEPSFMLLARQPGEGYRFLWLRTWHPAMVVRVHRVGQLAVAEVRRLDGRSPPAALGRLVATRRRTVSAAELAHLEQTLEAARFWSQPSHDPLDGTVFPSVEEGSRWVFEGYDDGRLQVVDRFSPDDPALVALGLELLSLAGVHPDPRTVY